MQHKFFPLFVMLWLVTASLVASAQDAANEADDATAEIKAAIQSYIAAFNARDVAKLVAHWSPEGVYISRTSGERVVGSEALTAEFTAMFAGDNVPRLAATTESIEFISPNVALERGTATVTRAEADVVESNYKVVYVKREGMWLIDRVTDDEIVVPSSNYEQLKELEWLVGEWVDDGDGITIEVDCKWTRNRNFISRSYTVSNGADVESSGLQIIGWDPQQKQIRSWLFDSDGGFIKGTWNKRGDRWIVQSVATLADGGSGSFTGVFRPLEDGNYSWQKVNQVVDGKLLPNVDEILVQRK
jgi:uncharacterized protein (TIGR02246 family)